MVGPLFVSYCLIDLVRTEGVSCSIPYLLSFLVALWPLAILPVSYKLRYIRSESLLSFWYNYELLLLMLITTPFCTVIHQTTHLYTVNWAWRTPNLRYTHYIQHTIKHARPSFARWLFAWLRLLRVPYLKSIVCPRHASSSLNYHSLLPIHPPQPVPPPPVGIDVTADLITSWKAVSFVILP